MVIQLIMEKFDYIYFRICDFYKKRGRSTAENTSMLILSLVQFYIFLDLLILLRIIWEYPIPNTFNKFWALPFVLLFPIMNRRKYLKANKYREFRLKWKDENHSRKKQNGIIIVLFILLLILIPILYGVIRQNIIEGKSFWG